LGIVAPKSIRVDRAELPNHVRSAETVDGSAPLADPCTVAPVECPS
jgi:sRNA-binding carbon storage regulator CsrA